MEFQVLYKMEGHNFVQTFHDRFGKNDFVSILRNMGIQATVIERDDRKFQVCKVAFDLNDVREYTFADPDKLAKPGDIVEVQCADGRIKNALVKSTSFMTIDEIKAFCNSIGYKKLGRVQKFVWRPAN